MKLLILLGAVILFSFDSFAANTSGGSCYFPQKDNCIDYLGKFFSENQNHTSQYCNRSSGIYSNASCSFENKTASCLMDEHNRWIERLINFYQPVSNNQAERSCQSIGGRLVELPDYTIIIPKLNGVSILETIQFDPNIVLGRLTTGRCQQQVRVQNQFTVYRYIRLVNDQSFARLIDISGEDPEDSLIGVYGGSYAPSHSEDERRLCLKDTVVNDSCKYIIGSERFPTADSCIPALQVPANSAVVVYLANYFKNDYDSIPLRVTTIR